MSEVSLCAFENAQYLFFSANIPPLIYYSHGVAFFVSLFLAVFVLFRARGSYPSWIFFGATVPFLLWVGFNVIIWGSNRSDLILFLWSLQIMLEPAVYLGMLYLVSVLAYKRDPPLWAFLFYGALYLPLIIATPTALNLPGFDIENCIPIEGFFGFYAYFVEFVAWVGIAVVLFGQYRLRKEASARREILVLATGSLAFLLAFAAGNFFGSITGDWVNSQYGLFGMPLLAVFLVYSIVRFRLFHIRLLSATALTIGILFLLLSLLLVDSLSAIKIIVVVSTIAVGILGTLLIRSVGRDVRQRERIERLAEELQKANTRLKELDQRKSEFVSLASHQLRSPLTAIKGYASMLLEGSFGGLSDTIKDAVDKIFESSNRLVTIIEDFLTISRIEQNRLVYNFTHFDFKELAEKIIQDMRGAVEKRGLILSFDFGKEKQYLVNADSGKIAQVLNNLIDNAMKYTPKGSILVRLIKDEQKRVITLSVKDTGIGMSEETREKIFSKFSRADNAHEVNVGGTGLGLFIAKQLIEAHNGRIWAESEGEGKGSTFYVELPAEK
ncbi:MAG: ATP-binding protein [bacterium]|nr:ATP-binding protein [bacterium]